MQVTVTDLRPHLTRCLGHVEFGDGHVKITRHGKLVGVIVPPMEWKRMFEAMEDETSGEVNPDTGRRPGAGLIRSWMPTDIFRVEKLKKPPPEGRARNWWWHWD